MSEDTGRALRLNCPIVVCDLQDTRVFLSSNGDIFALSRETYILVNGCDWKCRTSVLRCNFRISVESFSKWMKLLFRLINVVYFH